MANPAYQTFAGTAEAAAEVSAITVTKPTGLANTNLVLLYAGAKNGVSFTWPAGFVEIFSRQETGGTQGPYTGAAAYKVITNSGGEPASYTVTSSLAAYLTATATRFSNVDTVSPVNAFAHYSRPNNNGGATPDTPAVTTNRDEALILSIVVYNGIHAATPPAGYTEHYEFKSATTNRPSIVLASLAQAVAGTEDPPIWTLASGGTWVGATIALVPPGAIPPPSGDYGKIIDLDERKIVTVRT